MIHRTSMIYIDMSNCMYDDLLEIENTFRVRNIKLQKKKNIPTTLLPLLRSNANFANVWTENQAYFIEDSPCTFIDSHRALLDNLSISSVHISNCIDSVLGHVWLMTREQAHFLRHQYIPYWLAWPTSMLGKQWYWLHCPK